MPLLVVDIDAHGYALLLTDWPDGRSPISHGGFMACGLLVVAEPLPHVEVLFRAGYFQPFLDKYDADVPF